MNADFKNWLLDNLGPSVLDGFRNNPKGKRAFITGHLRNWMYQWALQTKPKVEIVPDFNKHPEELERFFQKHLEGELVKASE